MKVILTNPLLAGLFLLLIILLITGVIGGTFSPGDKEAYFRGSTWQNKNNLIYFKKE